MFIHESIQKKSLTVSNELKGVENWTESLIEEKFSFPRSLLLRVGKDWFLMRYDELMRDWEIYVAEM